MEDCPIVIVTHDLAQAKRIPDAAAFFWNQNGVGRLIETNQTLELFERQKM